MFGLMISFKLHIDLYKIIFNEIFFVLNPEWKFILSQCMRDWS